MCWRVPKKQGFECDYDYDYDDDDEHEEKMGWDVTHIRGKLDRPDDETRPTTVPFPYPRRHSMGIRPPGIPD